MEKQNIRIKLRAYDKDGLSNHTGGDMYIQLGNVSEDVLRDGYKSFENALLTVHVLTHRWEH